MRYFSLIGYSKNAVLIDPEGSEFGPFAVYKEKLIDNKIVSIGTLHDYLGHVARFVEYIYAASLIGLEPSKQSLDVLIRSYESYLLHGELSSNKIARDIAILTGRIETCSPSSLQVIEAALIHFLNLSDSLAKATGKDGLFSRFMPNAVIQISPQESAKLRGSSMFGGVIRGGAKKKNRGARLFLTTRKSGTNRRNSTQKRVDFQFPLNRIGDLLDGTKCFRDRAIYALLAASGLRTSEALQIRVEDIDIKNRLVYAHSPFERANPGIIESEFDLLRWKGRECADTFLIEPWASCFFEALQNYLRYEFIPSSGHPYIFQTLSGENRGRPYFAGDRSARIKQFKKRAEAIDVHLPKGDALHSLRHSYGVFVLNYLPTPNGLGLSETLVAHLMGHSDIKNTKIYARHDEEIIRAELEFSNRIIKGRNILKKEHILIDFYQKRIEELRKND